MDRRRRPPQGSRSRLVSLPVSRRTGGDTVKVQTTTGARASAPFIVDQHLVFSVNGKIQMFGDPEDFNNGVGQAGVRVLSWRTVR